MNYLVFFSLLFCCCFNQGYAQNTVTYKSSKGEYSLNDPELDTLKVNYDFDCESLTQAHWTLDELFALNKWGSVFNKSFGTKTDYLQQTYLNDIADDIYNFAKKYKYDSYGLLSITIAFVNSLRNVNNPSYNSSYFYFPYEMIFNGVHKDFDRQSLFAGLLSTFCFDISVVIQDKQMTVAVLVDHDEDVYYKDKKYKALTSNFRSAVLPIYSFDKICNFQKVYQDPVAPYFTYQLKEKEYMGNNQFAMSNSSASNGNYQVDVSTTSKYRNQFKNHVDNENYRTENERIKGYVISNVANQLSIVSEIK